MASAHGDRESEKLIGLEVLRFLSAIAVLIWHYQHFWHVGTDPVGFVRSSQPLYGVLRLFYEWGVYGVQLFWFISGYLFFWKYQDSIRSGKTGAMKFFVLRFSRLYPLHLVTFLLVLFLQFWHREITGQAFVYPHNDGYHGVLHLFMASHWGLQSGGSFNGPIWSVSLEVLAYALFFVFARHGGGSWRGIAGIALLSAIAFQLQLGQIFQCIFCFFVGGLIAQVGRNPWVVRNRMGIASAAIGYIALSALLFNLAGLFEKKLVTHLYITTAAPLLVFALASTRIESPWFVRLATLSGNTTYSSYLLHFPLQLLAMVAAAGTGWRVPRESPLFLCTYIALSVLLGAVVYRAFELPAQTALRRSWFQGKPREVAAT